MYPEDYEDVGLNVEPEWADEEWPQEEEVERFAAEMDVLLARMHDEINNA